MAATERSAEAIKAYGIVRSNTKGLIKVNSLVQWSDAHNSPETFREKAVLLKGKSEGSTLAGNGDGPDMIIYGKDAFWVWKNKVISALDGYDIYMVDSNHAPMPWLKDLFHLYPNVHIARFWEFEFPNGEVVHVRHGHEYFIDWYILRWIAPPVTHFMTDYFPKLWHWIAKKMGWMPGSGPVSEERYHIVVQRIWNNMIRLAIQRSKKLGRPVVVVSEHTHAIGMLTAAFHGRLVVMHADSGTVAIGSYCEIKDEVKLRRIDV